MSLRVLIADDDHVVRAGLVLMLSGTEIEVACQAANSAEAIQYAATVSPDVVLLDLHMPDESGFEALEVIKKQQPHLPVIIFSAHDSLPEMAHARGLGADAFVQKGERREILVRTIQRVAGGKTGWTRGQLRRICHVPPDKEKALSENPLSQREIQVLRMLVKGAVNEDIAEELQIHIETVKQHLKSIFRKFGVTDRTAAALWAVRKGLLEPPSAEIQPPPSPPPSAPASPGEAPAAS